MSVLRTTVPLPRNFSGLRVLPTEGAALRASHRRFACSARRLACVLRTTVGYRESIISGSSGARLFSSACEWRLQQGAKQQAEWSTGRPT